MKKWIAFLLVLSCLPFVLIFASCDEQNDAGVSYEITAEYSKESEALFAVQKFTYENRTDTVKDNLRFHLFPNAYREEATYKPISPAYRQLAYYDGDSHGEMSITSVLGGRGWQVCGEDSNILSVDLENPLERGDSVVLDISFVVWLAKVNHRTGVSDKAVNLGNFFPILCPDFGQGFEENVYYATGDPFVSECADFTFALTLPKNYVVAATGVLQEERSLEGKKKCVYKAQKVRDFALTFSPDYEVVEEKIGKTWVRYYYVDDAKPQEKLTVIKEAMTYFSGAFGEYPYETYAVAQTGFCMGGMEYPALTFVSAALSGKDALHAIVHETAHQWWYAAVGSDQIDEAWQDEGLTEYSTALFFEAHPRYDIGLQGLVAQSLNACRAYEEVYGGVLGADGVMSKRLDAFESDYAYRVLAYDKGVVLFDNLRRSVGDKKFFAALRKYYATGKYNLVTVGAIKGAFEKVGVDANGLFDCFLQGKALL